MQRHLDRSWELAGPTQTRLLESGNQRRLQMSFDAGYYATMATERNKSEVWARYYRHKFGLDRDRRPYVPGRIRPGEIERRGWRGINYEPISGELKMTFHGEPGQPDQVLPVHIRHTENKTATIEIPVRDEEQGRAVYHQLVEAAHGYNADTVDPRFVVDHRKRDSQGQLTDFYGMFQGEAVTSSSTAGPVLRIHVKADHNRSEDLIYGMMWGNDLRR